MLLKNKLNKLKKELKNDNVLTNLEERYCYATDAVNLKFDYEIPELVVFVETIQDVQKVLKYANIHEIPIIPRGAGTNMVGSCVSSKGGIVLNFSKMNKILEINTTNMTVDVQPGVILGDLKAAVESVGLFYPPDPSNYKVSTIGGSIAQSSGGALSFKYGTTKDYVMSLKVVLADGTLLTLGSETSKANLGYHLSQLIVGSEGTLAVIVEAKLKLLPRPKAAQLIVAYFDRIDSAVSAVNNIIKNHIFPASLEFMDKNSISTVEDFLHVGLNTDKECLLLINLDGDPISLNSQALLLNDILLKTDAASVIIPKSHIESDLYLNARRSSYAASARLAPDVVSDDIIVPRDKISNLVYECYNLAEKYSIKMCLVGHIGDGNLHPQVILNLENEEEYRNYINFRDRMYAHVKYLGGSISAEHGIGLEKKDFLKNTVDVETLNYMKSIKKVFDPKNILNPGKIFDINE